MLTSIIGRYGSGKTLISVYLASKTNLPIYANFQIKIDNYHELNIRDIFNLPNPSIIILDEAYTWLESRASSRNVNRYVSYILFQSRKRGLDIYTTSQLFRSVDVRFRIMSDFIILCSNNKRLQCFEYFFYRVGSGFTKLSLSYEKAKKYYVLYDTMEVVKPYQFDKLQEKIVKEI